MNILCIDYDNPFGPTPGGQYYSTKRSIFPLANKHHIHILTHGSGFHEQEKNITYIGMGPSKSFARILSKLEIFYFILKVRQYVKHDTWHDIVLEKFTSPIGPIGLPSLTSKPVIGFVNFAFWDEMTYKYKLPFNRITRQFLQNYNFTITNDEVSEEKIRAINPHITNLILPPYVDTSPPYQLSLTKNIIFIGRPDWHQKGLDLLIDILNQFHLRNINIQLIGFNATHPTWQRYYKKYRGPLTLKPQGYLSIEQRDDLIRKARFLIIPSRYESFGMVQLEAARYGKPTIAFDLPTFHKRQIAMALIPRFNREIFAQAIERLWQDQALYQKLSLASYTLAQQYQKGDHQEKLESFIEMVVKTYTR